MLLPLSSRALRFRDDSDGVGRDQSLPDGVGAKPRERPQGARRLRTDLPCIPQPGDELGYVLRAH